MNAYSFLLMNFCKIGISRKISSTPSGKNLEKCSNPSPRSSCISSGVLETRISGFRVNNFEMVSWSFPNRCLRSERISSTTGIPTARLKYVDPSPGVLSRWIDRPGRRGGDQFCTHNISSFLNIRPDIFFPLSIHLHLHLHKADPFFIYSIAVHINISNT